MPGSWSWGKSVFNVAVDVDILTHSGTARHCPLGADKADTDITVKDCEYVSRTWDQEVLLDQVSVM